MTEAHVVADSISPAGDRLTTIEVTMHRFVLAELNTHRVFSRNSASSRAIPVEKQLQRIKDNPAYPVSWPCEQPGMQGGALLEGIDLYDAQQLYGEAQEHAVAQVEKYLELHPHKENRLHKSVINRLLEPFMWHTVVITSSEWDNFWGLRCSPLAQPEIRVAAELMKEAYDASLPAECQTHLPYITDDDRWEGLGWEKAASQSLITSVARCARVSSLHAGEAKDYAQDNRLFMTLTTADPPHSSPLEHVAFQCWYLCPNHQGNFTGWDQLRHASPQLIEDLHRYIQRTGQQS